MILGRGNYYLRLRSFFNQTKKTTDRYRPTLHFCGCVYEWGPPVGHRRFGCFLDLIECDGIYGVSDVHWII